MASSTRGPATVPETLKPGIVNSNPDPNACIVCSTDLKRHSDLYKKSQTIFGCCGSDFCPSCVMLHHGKQCPVCGVDPNDPQDDIVRKMKRHAKKGQPWAQFLIGNCFAQGEYMMQSHYEAVRWYRKASAQGHPLATFSLGVHHMDGTGGCTRDLVAAMKYAEQGLAADPVAMKGVYEDNMLEIADGFKKEGNTEEAKRILEPLCLAGSVSAQMNLAEVYMNEKDWASAEEFFTVCAMRGHVIPAWNAAAICFDELKMFAKANAWRKFVRANIGVLPPSDWEKECSSTSFDRYVQSLAQDPWCLHNLWHDPGPIDKKALPRLPHLLLLQCGVPKDSLGKRGTWPQDRM